MVTMTKAYGDYDGNGNDDGDDNSTKGYNLKWEARLMLNMFSSKNKRGSPTVLLHTCVINCI